MGPAGRCCPSGSGGGVENTELRRGAPRTDRSCPCATASMGHWGGCGAMLLGVQGVERPPVWPLSPARRPHPRAAPSRCLASLSPALPSRCAAPVPITRCWSFPVPNPSMVAAGSTSIPTSPDPQLPPRPPMSPRWAQRPLEVPASLCPTLRRQDQRRDF